MNKEKVMWYESTDLLLVIIIVTITICRTITKCTQAICNKNEEGGNTDETKNR